MTDKELIENYERKNAAKPKPVYTRHTCNQGDGPYFGRLSPRTCPRCLELIKGEAKRDWIKPRT